MAKEQDAGESPSPKAPKRRARAKGAATAEQMLIVAGLSGEWMPVDELRGKALSALKEKRSVILDLAGVDHLDASSLQVLLALHAGQQACGTHLEFHNASPALCQWIRCAGAADYLPLA